MVLRNLTERGGGTTHVTSSPRNLALEAIKAAVGSAKSRARTVYEVIARPLCASTSMSRSLTWQVTNDLTLPFVTGVK